MKYDQKEVSNFMDIQNFNHCRIYHHIVQNKIGKVGLYIFFDTVAYLKKFNVDLYVFFTRYWEMNSRFWNDIA